MKIVLLMLAFVSSIWASSGQDLTTTWVGVLSLVLFLVGYYIIAAEEKYHINKAKLIYIEQTLISYFKGWNNQQRHKGQCHKWRLKGRFTMTKNKTIQF